MKLQNIGKFKLQFEYNADVYDIFVTKYSTCNDVIHMILHKSGIPSSNVKMHALFEKTANVERVLPGHALVYKIWRSWGCEKTSFSFCVKPKDLELPKRAENHQDSPTTECNIDTIYKNHYNKVKASSNLRRSYRHSSLKKAAENDPRTDQMSQKPSARVENDSSLSGKQIVLGRYLYDVLREATNRKQAKSNNLVVRENGDGKESSRFLTGNDVVFSQNVADDIDEVCDFDETECASFVEETVTLDTAFVKTSYYADSDEGIDVTSVESVDLDAAFIDETTKFKPDSDLDDVLVKFDETAEPESSIYRSKSRSKSSMIRNIFANNERCSEDDEMESFMHSRIEYST